MIMPWIVKSEGRTRRYKEMFSAVRFYRQAVEPRLYRVLDSGEVLLIAWGAGGAGPSWQERTRGRRVGSGAG